MFEKVDFSRLIRLKVNGPVTVSGRTVCLKSGNAVQLESCRDGVISQLNVTPGEAGGTLERLAGRFASAFIETAGRTYEFRRTKKGGVLTRSSANSLAFAPQPNDRPVGRVLSADSPALNALGFVSGGRIKADRQEKYRQICRFVEIVGDAVKGDALNIIDFGCGKAYLDFALYEYLTGRGIKVRVTGVDRRPDVVASSREVNQKLGYDIEFVCGDAADYPVDGADAVVALHACDTATDYALYNAVRAGVRYIFSVPCCQHEVNGNMAGGGLLADYGIVKERTAALATDAVRAACLEGAGYRVQVLEYVSDEGSLKNLMLRCARRGKPDPGAVDKAKRLLDGLGARQTLFELLYPDYGNLRRCGTAPLETERLILRRFTEADAPAMFEGWAADPEVCKYMTWRAHESIESVRRYLREVVKNYGRGDRFEWCIVWKETGMPIGSIGAYDAADDTRSANLGYCLARPYWGRGIMPEAGREVLRFLRDSAGLRRVSATHAAGNEKSGRVMQKIGMRYEGTLRRYGQDNAGNPVDVAIYAIVFET